jgi:DNA-binding CsgD family transcriptional regulator
MSPISVSARPKSWNWELSRVSFSEDQGLTARQRQVAELKITGLGLQAIGKRLRISAERVRPIEARLRTRAILHNSEPRIIKQARRQP